MRALEKARAVKVHGVPLKTIENWIKRLEDAGGDVNALAHQLHADAGRKRVMVTQAFDRAFAAADLPPGLLPELAAEFDRLIKAAWATRSQRSGGTLVGTEAATAFERFCGERGVTLPAAAFKMPKRRVYEEQKFRVIDVYEAMNRIAVFQHDAIKSGPFKDKSPMQAFAEHVAAGWRPVRVDTAALDSAFCKRDTRQVDRGAIRIGGERYRHPELAAANGRTVGIAKPWRRGAWPLVELPALGWAYLEPEMLHLPGDIAGAIEAGRMQRDNGRAVRELRREAGTIDLAANLRDRVAALRTRAAPAPLIDIYLAEEAQELAAARVEAERRQRAEPSERERRELRLQREDRRIERELERQYGNG